MNIVSIVRDVVPLEVRQEIKQAIRRWNDYRNDLKFNDPKVEISSAHRISLTQPIIRTRLFENKIHNIMRGCSLLSMTEMAPQKYWSFWYGVGRPSRANQFITGRNLVNGELREQNGGGLCQLSSLAYHLALLAGLKVIERHPHSIDIYQEHLRFAPLGADATVVWGFKDLRLFNPHEFPVEFKFVVDNERLVGTICSSQKILAHDVEFERIKITEDLNRVDTKVDGIVTATNLYQYRPV